MVQTAYSEKQDHHIIDTTPNLFSGGRTRL